MLQPSHIIISPGPCTPGEAGISTEVVRRFGPYDPDSRRVPGASMHRRPAYGAGIVRAGRPMHVKASRIRSRRHRLFCRSPPTPFPAARYHSLVISRSRLPADLRVTASAEGRGDHGGGARAHPR